ncbi:chitooligosaccharidolytic beta-N-acetylglucosaminidase-like [Tigriopus californicus]|uniref:chitooligosaccharidolytic beta-N-acetylglucosaminidase-like n=1 Tax=Tigriopus californicus TaxID=6832 RepID=UPI0027DA1EE0|nr:chitooligosaccharidolytic beta-N-acetylglucosaminidase-like [Tigriopus californicus]
MVECQLTCDEYALLWPKPKSAQLGKTVSTVSVSRIDLVNDDSGDVQVIKMLHRIINDQIAWMKLKSNEQSPNSSEHELRITYLGGDGNSTEPKICRESQEGYTLSTAKAGSVITIEDLPKFSHRGISLDTSRNFIPAKTFKHDPIRCTLNTRSINTQDQIKDILEYANYRGVQVIPEQNQPAHVGHGWNFPGAENYTVCLNAEPWYDYCVEPPCGQLNPGEAEIYNVLEKLYTEFYDMLCSNSPRSTWEQMKSISRSGTRANWYLTTWLKLDVIRRKKLWCEFQEKSSAKLKSVYETKKDENETSLRIIVWTSRITLPEYNDNLDPDTYTIQIWTKGSNNLSDPTISSLLDKGYDVIFSNYESTYLNCGFGAWVGEGKNWCSPYMGWQELYENDIYKLVERRGFQLTDKIKSQILGGETNMWSEQVDNTLVEGNIFPRSNTFAERLWSNPSTNWYEAETRILNHRHSLVQRGIRAAALQPEWFRLNEGQCYGNTDTPNFEIAASETTTDTLEASST